MCMVDFINLKIQLNPKRVKFCRLECHLIIFSSFFSFNYMCLMMDSNQHTHNLVGLDWLEFDKML